LQQIHSEANDVIIPVHLRCTHRELRQEYGEYRLGGEKMQPAGSKNDGQVYTVRRGQIRTKLLIGRTDKEALS
jgi:hypothetical protein